MVLKLSRSIRVLGLLVLVLAVGACSPALPNPQPTQSIVPTAAPSAVPAPAIQESALATPVAASVPVEATPVPGKAAIKGELVTDKGFGPIAGTQFYLKPASEEAKAEGPWTLVLVGPETDKGDVVGQSGPRGEFFLNDIAPGNYYLIVWAPLNWIPIETEGEVTGPREFELKPDEIADLGRLVLSWP